MLPLTNLLANVRDHNAIVIYEQTHNNYLVCFEVDLQGMRKNKLW